MSIKNKACIVLQGLLIASALSSSIVMADQTRGFYAGISVGQVKSDFEDKLKKSSLDESASEIFKVDEKSTGWKITGGYQFNQYLGAEVFYADLGKSELKTTVESHSISGSVKAKGVGIVGVATWPINEQFGLFGKAGGLYWKTEIDTKPAVEHKSDDDKNGFSPMFGLGARYAFNERISVKIEWERFLKVGDEKLNDGLDLDLVSAGIVYSF